MNLRPALLPCGRHFFSFNLTCPTSRWWSDATSAPLLTLVSCRFLLNFLSMVMWSIWLTVGWSGDTQVPLWISLCWNTLPPITKLLNTQKSANISPFSFMVPDPSLPMILSLPVLSFPIFALKSPVTMRMSLLLCHPVFSAIRRRSPLWSPPLPHWLVHSS